MKWAVTSESDKIVNMFFPSYVEPTDRALMGSRNASCLFQSHLSLLDWSVWMDKIKQSSDRVAWLDGINWSRVSISENYQQNTKQNSQQSTGLPGQTTGLTRSSLCLSRCWCLSQGLGSGTRQNRDKLALGKCRDREYCLNVLMSMGGGWRR